MCFMWCHVRHLRPKKNNATKITAKDREFGMTPNYDGINFPVKVSDIGKIERMNEINLTVLGYKGKKQFYPIRVSKGEYKDSMELPLLGDGKGNLHYVLIKDVNRLLFSVTKGTNKKHFCLHCFHNCSSEELHEKHKETCIQVNGVPATKLPKEGTKIKFKNYKHQVPAPFVIYADFESILVPDKERKMDETSDESHTTRYQTHQACSYGMKRVCYYDDWYSGEYKSYIGKDAARNFIQAVLYEAKICNRIMKTQFNKPMKLTEEEEYQNADYCHICTKWLDDNDAVRDHCHVTGKFRGAAHSKCNLNYKLTYKIPVVFHNLRGYDSHLIMQEIGGFGLEVNVIPNNMEKYMSFSLGKQFMASSLEALAVNLSQEYFKLVGQRWKGEDFELVTKKGIFPYEYLDSINKSNVKKLPSKDEFYSTLYESGVSTALTATNEHTLPLFLSDYPGNDKSQPINVRLTQRKPYRSPVTTSNRCNVIEVPIDYKQNTHSSTMLKNQSRSREFVPNIVLTNVMSLLPKIDEIRVFTETHSIDLFFISETWLKSNVGDDQLILPGYNLKRLDRRIGIHGGVCLFSNSKYKTSHLYNLECPNLEVMWVYGRTARLHRGVSCIVTATIYHPPSSDDNEILEYLIASLTRVESLYPGCGLILAGDFNRLDIKQLRINFGLKQLVKIPTRGGNTLDLVLTNLDPFYLSDSIIAFPPFGLSDHSVIAVSPRLRDPKSNQKKVVYKRDMRPSRKAMFGRYLSQIDWSFLDSLESVEVKNQLFTDMLSFGLFYILPEKRLLVHSNDHPWINEDLRRLIQLRQRAFEDKSR